MLPFFRKINSMIPNIAKQPSKLGYPSYFWGVYSDSQKFIQIIIWQAQHWCSLLFVCLRFENPKTR